MPALDEKDHKILEAICQWKMANDGDSPAYDDLVALLGISRSIIHYHIRRLIAHGLIRANKRRRGFNLGGTWTPPSQPTG